MAQFADMTDPNATMAEMMRELIAFLPVVVLPARSRTRGNLQI
jgi:hypothetical protein